MKFILLKTLYWEIIEKEIVEFCRAEKLDCRI
jgi:hypothetical protein